MVSSTLLTDNIPKALDHFRVDIGLYNNSLCNLYISIIYCLDLNLLTWQIVNISGLVFAWILPIVMAPDENAIAKGTKSSCHAMCETGTINIIFNIKL